LKVYCVEIKPTAESDITNRYQQIAEESPKNALNWYINIIEAIGSLDVMAERCPIAPEDVDIHKEIRHLIIGNYRALYRISDNTVEVLHVRHDSMDRKL